MNLDRRFVRNDWSVGQASHLCGNVLARDPQTNRISQCSLAPFVLSNTIVATRRVPCAIRASGMSSAAHSLVSRCMCHRQTLAPIHERFQVSHRVSRLGSAERNLSGDPVAAGAQATAKMVGILLNCFKHAWTEACVSLGTLCTRLGAGRRCLEFLLSSF